MQYKYYIRENENMIFDIFPSDVVDVVEKDAIEIEKELFDSLVLQIDEGTYLTKENENYVVRKINLTNN